jgi:hypothetical protein
MQRGKQSDDCVHYWRPASEKKNKSNEKEMIENRK